MTDSVKYSELTGRLARIGDTEDQRRSTWDKIAEAIDAQDASSATDLAHYVLDAECRLVFDLLGQWADHLRGLLADKGVQHAELGAIERRLREVLAYPDGSAYDVTYGWERLADKVESLCARLQRAEWDEASALVREACETWRIVHDRVVDMSYGWMSEYAERFGEEAIPEMFRAIGEGHFTEFFNLGDPERHAWVEGGADAVLLDTLEAMRVHLSTWDRNGAPIQMTEHPDRWEFEFDPCGSGGRALRGDIIEGTPSRIEAPYRFGVIKGAYEWTDGKAGVCIYCNHCQQIYEQWTIDAAGIPFLVIDPPTVTDGVGHANPKRCRYTIYKRPESVPEEVYRRCGREPPRVPR